MSLADIQIPTETVEYHGGDFQVRGLSFADLGILMRHYQEDIDYLVDTYLDAVMGRDDFDIERFATSLITDFADVVAMLIACSAGEYDQTETVKKLPPAVQMMALAKIWNLTVEEAGGLKKLVGGITEAISKMREQIEAAEIQVTGITSSEEQ